jgi:hypothetical protein
MANCARQGWLDERHVFRGMRRASRLAYRAFRKVHCGARILRCAFRIAHRVHYAASGAPCCAPRATRIVFPAQRPIQQTH